MGRNKECSNIDMKLKNRILLEEFANSQTGKYRKLQHLKILLLSANGMSNNKITFYM